MKLRVAWYIAVVAIMLLQSAAVMAHDTGLVYARLERDSSGGTVTLQATVECLGNPLVPTQEAAKEALQTLFDLQSASHENGGVGVIGRAVRGKLLGIPQWSVQFEWTDPSVPVSVQGPEDDAEEHCWITAKWELELPKHEAVCLHVNADTKLGALLWEVQPSGQSPDGKTRWQILLPGERSARLNVPQEMPKSESVMPTASLQGATWGLPMADGRVVVLVVIFALLGASLVGGWLLYRLTKKSCADMP